MGIRLTEDFLNSLKKHELRAVMFTDIVKLQLMEMGKFA